MPESLGGGDTRDKDCTPVEFPVSGLDMAPYVSGSGGEAEGVVYDLLCFCNHVGSDSVRNGHYIAYCRDAPSRADRRTGWREFNDQKVTEVRNIEDLLQPPSANDNNTHAQNYYNGHNQHSRDARRDVYVLIYKKRSARW